MRRAVSEQSVEQRPALLYRWANWIARRKGGPLRTRESTDRPNTCSEGWRKVWTTPRSAHGDRVGATAAQGCPSAADLQGENRTDGFDKEESHVLQLMRRRLQGEREDGFTLIELMVVVLIIAILIAIAIPTFLGARQRAQNRAAQSSLRNALTAAKTIYTDSQTYASATDAAMTAVEPSLDFVAGTTASGNQNTVSVS